MKNFGSLFVAYMIVWAVFFVYEVTISRRLSQLLDELEQLKARLGRK